MAQKTTLVTAPIDQGMLTTIDAHALVAPVAAAHGQLRAEQARLTAELAEVRKRLIAESDTSDPLIPSWGMRQARKRAEEIQEALEEVRVALFESTERLEAARSETRAAMRPALRQEARLVLTTALEVVEASQAAQTAIEELEWRARRLGISLPFAGCVDLFLPTRVEVIRKALARLQN
jgi:hypothetical protein